MSTNSDYSEKCLGCLVMMMGWVLFALWGIWRTLAKIIEVLQTQVG